MAQEQITRARLLVALRRVIPGASARRLGDLIDAGEMLDVALEKKTDLSMAFGVVLQGSLSTHLGTETPTTARVGETFCLAQYALIGEDLKYKASAPMPNTRVLIFSHEIITALGLATPIINAFGARGSNNHVRSPIRPM